ncbi:protein phosphatase 1H [Bombina bombina]|uniref:protein phosphatase 1H n=1 Tax=Bombina bombina TaxID=8345 RepID=UPI00235A9162|nr:protein phosphatase 1H [Bombina bombina]
MCQGNSISRIHTPACLFTHLFVHTRKPPECSATNLLVLLQSISSRSVMISKVRVAVSGLVGSWSNKHNDQPRPEKALSDVGAQTPRAPCRPAFLGLSQEELQASGDHAVRTVLCQEGPGDLQWGTGYAEVVNAGKSQHNEDQACCEFVTVEKRDGKLSDHHKEWPSTDRTAKPEPQTVHKVKNESELHFYYWGLFDGHAGCGCAMVASRLLHLHICDQLRDLVDILQQSAAAPICLELDARAEQTAGAENQETSKPPPERIIRFHLEKQVFSESLVIGALENAFKEMDEQIARERTIYKIEGGCCALAAVYLMGKLYVANAGDSRAIIIQQRKTIPMSQEFTPETERQRLQFLGFLKPELLGNEFTYLQFPRRIQQNELGKRMLYRDHTMTGWAYKTIDVGDMKFPLIYGEGKKARVMATIGVTRGLGDHDLKVFNSNIYIKPFLSCTPDVRVYDLTDCEHSADDVMVMGTDGLWDVISDTEVADVVQRVFSVHGPDKSNRYNLVAQELVLHTRGVLKENSWRLPNGGLGSGDDISVFVIPLAGHST